MTKPTRSPVLGYNHNLRYRGRLFHVQTEDSGPTNPHLYTHLFYEGTILSSKKHAYDAESPEETVKTLMQGLHKSMIRELTRGEHDPKVIAFFAARGEPAYSEPPPASPAAAPQAVVAAPPATPPGATPPPYDVQISAGAAAAAGGIAGPPTAVGRPSLAPAPVVTTAGAVSPGAAAARRPGGGVKPPMVVVKPTDLKRLPMAFGQSADGVVVQRSALGGVVAAKVPHAVSDARAQPAVAARAAAAPPPPPARPAGAPQAHIPRGRTPSPIDKPFSELVSDKSLDDVILEYLSDDGEPQKR
jgi:hypothetical protein